GNGRASFWNDEMADGPPQIPDQGTEKSQGRTGPRGAELQSQTGHQHPRSPGAAASARPSPRLRTNLTSQQPPPSCRSKKSLTSHTACLARMTTDRQLFLMAGGSQNQVGDLLG